MNKSNMDKSGILQLWKKWLILFKGKKIALYGAGEHTEMLEQYLQDDFYRLDISAIFDRLPIEKEIFGIPVFCSEHESLNSFDFIIISSKHSQNAIEEFLLTQVHPKNIGCLYKREHEDIFIEIYNNNHWGSDESISGPGSEYIQTKELIDRLPHIFQKYSIKSLLDIPCGDVNWVKNIIADDMKYHGADIVEPLIADNKKNNQSKHLSFSVMNLLRDSLPKVDAVLCRDCLVHFSNSDISQAILNLVKSKAKYLITTTFISTETNRDINTGEWRPINLRKSPFFFPEPIKVILEKCSENNDIFQDKALAIWLVDDLKASLNREKK